MSSQQQVPMAMIAGYVFNVGSMIAIDLTAYSEDQQSPAYMQRRITLHLVGPVSHLFKQKAADEMYDWYLGISGQRKVQPVQFPARN